MRDTLMNADEMSLAKDSNTRSLPGRFERGTDAAGTFAELFIYDLPLEYYSKLPETLNAVTAEQAQAAAQKHILPEKIIVLAVLVIGMLAGLVNWYLMDPGVFVR